jgi:hypothetical protein
VHASIPAAASTSPIVTVDIIPVLAADAAGNGTLDGEPTKVVASMTQRSPTVTGDAPNDTTVTVHAFGSVDCATQVVTARSNIPSTMNPPLLRPSRVLRWHLLLRWWWDHLALPRACGDACSNCGGGG